MTCENCGAATELKDTEGGVKEGRFVEKYSCVSCDAWGTIQGDAAEPAHMWERKGPIFNGY